MPPLRLKKPSKRKLGAGDEWTDVTRTLSYLLFLRCLFGEFPNKEFTTTYQSEQDQSYEMIDRSTGMPFPTHVQYSINKR